MKLVQFCQEYGLSTAILNSEDVRILRDNGFLSEAQAEELLEELDWIDRLWRPKTPDVKCADSLW